MFEETDQLETRFDYAFEFKPGYYATNKPYQGRYKFSKHFYPMIDDLIEDSEEWQCAKLIDSHQKVKYWIRNLVKRESAAFRLPTATDWFYPDFVAELSDGRLLVVEHKGKGFATNDDSLEKKAVGECRQGKAGVDACF